MRPEDSRASDARSNINLEVATRIGCTLVDALKYLILVNEVPLSKICMYDDGKSRDAMAISLRKVLL